MTCKPKGVGAGRRGDVCLGIFWFISGSTGSPFFKEQGFSQGAVCSSLRMQLSLKPAACFFKGQGFFQVAVRASLRVQLSYPFKSLQFFVNGQGFFQRGGVFFFSKGATIPSKACSLFL